MPKTRPLHSKTFPVLGEIPAVGDFILVCSLVLWQTGDVNWAGAYETIYKFQSSDSVIFIFIYSVDSFELYASGQTNTNMLSDHNFYQLLKASPLIRRPK